MRCQLDDSTREVRKCTYAMAYRFANQRGTPNVGCGCIGYPSVTAPDVTVEIYEDTEQQNQWRIIQGK